MTQKPGKPAEDVTSYRPISLLPVPSKVLERLLLTRLMPIIEEKQLISEHQFGFRRKHSTIDQVHRLVEKIQSGFEAGKYCAAVFLDISQAFDKIWHEGLLYKIKLNFPPSYYILLKSYLSERHFIVRHGNAVTELNKIRAGVPQGSVLGPILYLLYTADLPTQTKMTIGTFADDTAVLATHHDRMTASRMLQDNINSIDKWLKRWRIKVNETKSIQITFTLKHKSCPPIYINGVQIPQADEVRYLGMHLDKRLT